MDDDVRRRIQQRADGNPLFVEQLVETLAFGSGTTMPLGRAAYLLLT